MSEIKMKLSSKKKERAVELELSNNKTKLKMYSGDNKAELKMYSSSKRKERAVELKSSEQNAELDINSLKILQIRETVLKKKMKLK